MTLDLFPVAKRAAHHLDFQSVDPQLDAIFQKKVGSIVRKSGGSFGSGSTLRGSACKLNDNAYILTVSMVKFSFGAF